MIPSQLCERIPGRSGHKIQILSFYPTVDVLSPQLHRGTLHEQLILSGLGNDGN